MRFSSKSVIIAGAAALSLSLIGCHGQSGGAGYVPPSTSTLSAMQTGGGVEPAGKQKVEITSKCGHRLHIVIAGIVDCQFREDGYKNGTFTVTNLEKGIVGVTPSSGTQSTTFTIVGILTGSGKLVWKDTKGHHYAIRVRVDL